MKTREHRAAGRRGANVGEIIMIMQFLYNAMDLSVQTEAWVMDVLEMDVDVGCKGQGGVRARGTVAIAAKAQISQPPVGV